MGLAIEVLPDLGVTRISRWVFNCYVLHNNGAPIVVDAGLPSALEDAASVLDRLGGQVRAIVATHGHSDHVAGAGRLAENHQAPISTMTDQPFDRRAGLGLLTGARVAGYGTPAGMRWTGPPPAGTLTAGKPLPGAGDWEVVAAPGHTDDSFAFWNPSTRTLLSGDAVLTARGRAWHTPETVDTAAAQQTRKRLEKLPVAHLLPGHGRVVHAYSDASVWHRQR